MLNSGMRLYEWMLEMDGSVWNYLEWFIIEEKSLILGIRECGGIKVYYLL